MAGGWVVGGGVDYEMEERHTSSETETERQRQ